MRETIEAFTVFIMLCLAFFIGLMIGRILMSKRKHLLSAAFNF